MKKISTEWLFGIVPIACIVFSANAFAETFWAHGINKRVDVAYGEDPQQIMDVYVHGDRVGEPTYLRLTPHRGQPWCGYTAGASAGGHLALVVGMLNSTGDHPCKTQTPPKAVVNWFGITDIEMVDEYLNRLNPKRNYARAWAGSAADVAKVSSDYSPMYLIADQTPPIISIHGTDDTVVPYQKDIYVPQQSLTRV